MNALMVLIKEQLSLLVRYVVNDKVRESFVGFFELSEGVWNWEANKSMTLLQ